MAEKGLLVIIQLILFYVSFFGLFDVNVYINVSTFSMGFAYFEFWGVKQHLFTLEQNTA